MVLILYCLAVWTFSQSTSSQKSGCSVCWQLYPYTELLRQQSRITYTSPQPVPIRHITEQIWTYKLIISPSCVLCSAFPVILALSFSQGINLMGNNLGSNEVTSFLSRHMPDNECSSAITIQINTTQPPQEIIKSYSYLVIFCVIWLLVHIFRKRYIY